MLALRLNNWCSSLHLPKEESLRFTFEDSFSSSRLSNPAPSARVPQTKMREDRRTKMAKGKSPRSSLARAHTSRSLRSPTSWNAPCTPECPWPSYPAEITPASTRKLRLIPTATSAARSCLKPKMWVLVLMGSWWIAKNVTFSSFYMTHCSCGHTGPAGEGWKWPIKEYLIDERFLNFKKRRWKKVFFFFKLPKLQCIYANNQWVIKVAVRNLSEYKSACWYYHVSEMHSPVCVSQWLERQGWELFGTWRRNSILVQRAMMQLIAINWESQFITVNIYFVRARVCVCLVRVTLMDQYDASVQSLMWTDS